jgi:hypothetical protein
MFLRIGVSCLTICLASPAWCAEPAQIAGTGSPPTLQDSFAGLQPGFEYATAFRTAAGTPATISRLQVAAYHYNGVQGDVATFRIYSNVLGKPSAELALFEATNLPGLPAADPPSTAPLLSLAPSNPVVLQPSATYWLAGSTTQQQVNWVHGLNVFMPDASRSTGGVWSVSPGSNALAFALFATPIPEPSSAVLIVCMVGALVARQKRQRRV